MLLRPACWCCCCCCCCCGPQSRSRSLDRGRNRDGHRGKGGGTAIHGNIAKHYSKESGRRFYDRQSHSRSLDRGRDRDGRRGYHSDGNRGGRGADKRGHRWADRGTFCVLAFTGNSKVHLHVALVSHHVVVPKTQECFVDVPAGLTVQVSGG